MKHIFLFLTTLLAGTFSYGQAIEGLVFNANTKETIPYVNIYVKEAPNMGTTTNEDGEFYLERTEITAGQTLVFSAIGYAEVALPIAQATGKLEVAMRPTAYFLDEVEVGIGIDPNRKTVQYGSVKQKILSFNEQTTGLQLEKKGMLGVLVKPKTSYKAPLLSFSYYIADEGKLSSRFAMRILALNSEKPITSHSITSFENARDVTRKPIVFTAEQRGWNTINLQQEKIVLPNTPFLLYIYPIDDGKQFVWENSTGTKNYYGAVIASYYKKDADMQLAFISVANHTFYTLRGAADALNAPAIVLECEKK